MPWVGKYIASIKRGKAHAGQSHGWFCLTSDWLRKWREIFQPITWDSNWISRDKNYDFDSWLKRALNCYMNYHGNVACENIRFSSLLGTFREEERLRLRGRNSILMTQINVYIINPVVMGFQIQICPILHVFWSILVKFWVYLPTSSSKTQTLPLEKSIFHKYWLFCSKFFAFTFDLCGLLSFVCHS